MKRKNSSCFWNAALTSSTSATHWSSWRSLSARSGAINADSATLELLWYDDTLIRIMSGLREGTSQWTRTNLSVELLQSLLSITTVGERNERKPSWSSSFPVHNDLCISYCAETAERVFQVVISCLSHFHFTITRQSPLFTRSQPTKQSVMQLSSEASKN